MACLLNLNLWPPPFIRFELLIQAIVSLHSVPVLSRVSVDRFLERLLGLLYDTGTAGLRLRCLSRRSGASAGHPKFVGDVIAFADAARGEPEPVREYATALVVRVVGQEAVQSVLLLTSAAVPAIHLLVFVGALFPVHVLLEGVQVEQGEHLSASVVGPEGSHYLLFHGARVSVKGGINCVRLQNVEIT